METYPDPLALEWPRHTARATLRPLTLDDVDAVWAYRRLPEVVQHLSHDVLTREEVVERIRRRTPGGPPTPGRLVRGIAMVVDGGVVGDGMLRVTDGPEGDLELWIGYALHPSAWGQGYATELARALVAVGEEMRLPVVADAYAANVASHRVLLKAGLTLRASEHMGDDVKNVYRLDRDGARPRA